MKLKSVVLDNFRAIRHLELPLHHQLMVLVGENAAGKSTVLDGIAVGLGAMVSRFPNIRGASFKSGDKAVAFRPRDIHSSSFSIDISNSSHKSDIILCCSPMDFVRVSLSTIGGISWDRTKSRDKTVTTRKRTPKGKGLSELYDALDPIITTVTEQPNTPQDLPLVVYYGTGRAVLTLPQRKRNFRSEFTRFEALQDALKATTNFKGVFEWFISQEDEERRERERLRDWDYRSPMLDAVRNAIERMIPHGKDPRTETNPLRFLLTVEIEPEHPEVLSLEQLSDGYRTLLALVMDLARRMAQANPHRGADAIESEAVVLIDEVDLHLHPNWQQRVLVDLMNTFPNTQFIVTTHSPQVLTSIPPQHIVRLVRTEQGIQAEQATSSYGAESGRLLEEIMAVSPRPPADQNEFTRTLGEYRSLIEAGQGESDTAIQLRTRLEELNHEDPALLRADMEIRRRRLLGK